MKRHPWKTARLWQCLTIAALLILGCRDKDGRYFFPNPFGPPIDVTDLVPPTIENLRPSTDIILSETRISFDAFDTGQPLSGLDISRLRARYGTLQLPVTRLGTGNTYEIGIDQIGEGQRLINLEAFDFAGNERNASYSLTTDWSGPTATFVGPTAGSSMQSTAQVNISGTYADASGISVAQYFVRQPVGGQCVATGGLYLTGTGAGTVGQNRYELGTSGVYDLNLILNAPSGSLPQTITYCWHFHAEDVARDRNGNDRPNFTDRFWKLDFTWSSAPQVHSVAVTPNNISLTHPTTQQMIAMVSADPGASTSVTWSATPATVGTIDQNGLVTTVGAGQLDLQACSAIAPTVCGAAQLSVLQTPFNFAVSWSLVSWNHVAFGGGLSNTCGRGQAVVTQGMQTALVTQDMQAALVGSPYTVSWTGPGIVGSSTRNGTLDANGEFFDRQAIAAFGNYTVTVSVTSDGITRTATGTTTVNSGAGSCPPP